MAKQINKLPKNWADDDLVGWAQGSVTPGNDVSVEALVEEANKRMGTELESADDVKAAILKAAEPEDAGVTTAEEAPVAEEPAAQPEAEPTPAPAPAPKETPKESTATGATQQMIENNLNEYIEKMKPGRAHTGNEGPTTQLKLYRTIQTVLRQQGSEFTRSFNELLKTVHEHRDGVFHERYLFRYFDAIALTGSERRNFERMLNLLLTTCNPATRSKTVKQVDLDATMEGFKNSEMHQRVIGFYTNV